MAVALARLWTLEEMHALPEDGNKYELLYGELLVTPAPTTNHESVLARLSALLTPFVMENGLGLVYHPRAVVRHDGSEVEPDLQVRQPVAADVEWQDAPVPVLVVEVLSQATSRNDRLKKRPYYVDDVGVHEYWIVDPKNRAITSIGRDRPDVVYVRDFAWQPPGCTACLAVRWPAVFGP